MKTYVMSVPLYGSECWARNKERNRKLEAVEMWFIGGMMRLSWMKTQSNELLQDSTPAKEPSQEKYGSNSRHVSGLSISYISNRLLRTSTGIGLSFFLRINDQPIGQQRSALSPRLGRNKWSKKWIDERRPLARTVIISTSRIDLSSPYGLHIPANKTPTL
ncbi:hypothetical protein PoB_004834400 [Plakobranchus ocellatus]|uniref:Uncharacterized protein n=1 Tax=Plakobranchus ocellatus TaxID=259542 RepID=A0AAV4BTZ9_9GAST|nr:hypothetical protein PoB_004834400 [Plakobranchus ocellatus]